MRRCRHARRDTSMPHRHPSLGRLRRRSHETLLAEDARAKAVDCQHSVAARPISGLRAARRQQAVGRRSHGGERSRPRLPGPPGDRAVSRSGRDARGRPGRCVRDSATGSSAVAPGDRRSASAVEPHRSTKTVVLFDADARGPAIVRKVARSEQNGPATSVTRARCVATGTFENEQRSDLALPCSRDRRTIARAAPQAFRFSCVGWAALNTDYRCEFAYQWNYGRNETFSGA